MTLRAYLLKWLRLDPVQALQNHVVPAVPFLPEGPPAKGGQGFCASEISLKQESMGDFAALVTKAQKGYRTDNSMYCSYSFSYIRAV